jgi:predicted transcriptional regulator
MNGRFSLRQLSPDADGHVHAILDGQVASAQLDEKGLDPMSVLKNGVADVGVSALGLLAILKWLVAPLFTRLSKSEALEHPRRKTIFEYIQLYPGANFREIARGTGIAAGTVRHHLNVLERSELVVEHSHGSTVRLFENHGKFDHNWSDLVLLREPPLAKVHAWLKEHPDSPQKAVLEAMDRDGWSRSTTQHRLARLVDGGLATIRLQGRLKIYAALEGGKASRPAAVAGPAVGARPV